jgi:hypothetical protein
MHEGVVMFSDAPLGDQSSDTDKFEFEGDFDFTMDRHPVLSVLVPLDVLKSLVSAGPSRFLEITQSEVVGLLGLIVRNPNTSEDNRAAAQSLVACSLIGQIQRLLSRGASQSIRMEVPL